MKKNIIFMIQFLIFFSLSGLVYGQGFTGPGSGAVRQGQAVTVTQPITVAEAKTLPRDSWVILTGYIVKALPGGKHYIFRDSTGEITVEIEWKVWRGLSVGASDRVTIYGELETRRGQPAVEVEAITGQSSISSRQGQAVTITQPIKVSEAKTLPRNSWVVLTGHIVSSLRGEYYLFRDSSGEITVEIEHEVWRGLSASPSDAVEISGEIEIERGQVSIDVKAIRKI